MKLIIIANIIMGSLYLWGVECNRYLCGALWLIAPFVNLALLGIKEWREDHHVGL